MKDDSVNLIACLGWTDMKNFSFRGSIGSSYLDVSKWFKVTAREIITMHKGRIMTIPNRQLSSAERVCRGSYE